MMESCAEQERPNSVEVGQSATVHVYPTGTLCLKDEVLSVDSFKIKRHCPNEDHDYLSHSDEETEYPYREVKEEEEEEEEDDRTKIFSKNLLIHLDREMESWLRRSTTPRHVPNLDFVLREMGEGRGNAQLFRAVRMVIESRIPVPEVIPRVSVCLTSLYHYLDIARERLRIIAEQQVTNELEGRTRSIMSPMLKNQERNVVQRQPPATELIDDDKIILPNGKIVGSGDILVATTQVASRVGTNADLYNRLFNALNCILMEGRSTDYAAHFFHLNVTSLGVCVSRTMDKLDSFSIGYTGPIPTQQPQRQNVVFRMAQPAVKEIVLYNGKKTNEVALNDAIDEVVSHSNRGQILADAIRSVLTEVGVTDEEAARKNNIPKCMVNTGARSVLERLGCVKMHSFLETNGYSLTDEVILPNGTVITVEDIDRAINQVVPLNDWTKNSRARNTIYRILLENMPVEEAMKIHRPAKEAFLSCFSDFLEMFGCELTGVKGKSTRKRNRKSAEGTNETQKKKKKVDKKEEKKEKEDEEIDEPLEPYTFGEGEEAITVDGERTVTFEGVVLPQSTKILYKVVNLGFIDNVKSCEFKGTKEEIIEKITEIVSTYETDILPIVKSIYLFLTEGKMDVKKVPARTMVYQKLIPLLYNPITIVETEDSEDVNDEEESGNEKENEEMSEKEEKEEHEVMDGDEDEEEE